VRRTAVSIALTLAIALALWPQVGAVQTAAAPSVFLILVNGRVWTGNDAQPWASAVAMSGDKIVAVGTNAQIRKMAARDARVIDLGGRFAMPGFNDAHIHFLGGALKLIQVDLTGARSLEEIQRRVKQFAQDHPNEPWITGSGWEYSYLPNQRLPTRADLDAVIADRPVFLSSYDGHTAWVNSRAFELSGVNAQTKFDGYGVLVKDEKGEPTGVLKEGAQRLVRAKIPEPSRAQKLDALRGEIALANSLGITSIQNASGSEAEVELYKELLDRGELKLAVRFAISVGPQTTQADIDRIAALAKKYAGPRLNVGAIKIVLDGVIETHTAAMLDPYSDDPSTAGRASYTAEQVNRIVTMADRAGLQVFIHAIGDRAVRMALDAFQTARTLNGRRDSRWRIEHIETLQQVDIPRFAKLGVIASMEPIHADPATIDVWSRAIGPDRTKRGFAWHALELAGARLMFSSDWPAAISLDPIRGLHNAVNRQTIEGAPKGGWLPEHRVSVETALKAYTAVGAYASFEENTKGRVALGMFADLIVLSADPFKVEHAELFRCHVATTIFRGAVTYEAK
jgi:predicted amidohydrolase YtcJ